MNYETFELREDLAIRRLITFFYREMPKDYFFAGEQHDFWEIVYVDKGEWDVTVDNVPFHLEQGDLVFYGPNEFHRGGAALKSTPNVIIITFECVSPVMDYFASNRVFRLDDRERAIFASLVKAGFESFDPPIDSPKMRKLYRREGAPFGSEQLIRNHLENMLIQLIRRGQQEAPADKPPLAVQENRVHDITSEVTEYMKAHLRDDLTMEELCRKFQVSRTLLKTAFKQQTGQGVLEAFNQLKIERAKALIREEKLSFTEIAEELGYSSIHYFSRQFKKLANMTPTEYARSVKLRALDDQSGCWDSY
ncbi:AraC family transcriptional regulator [Paenibacillus ginsengarvi]|uniref:AraC family transcriptional regulator n=1 Tax=Paenibacillus ginsengarvi TaxID=400777 RepID=A0A3B0BX76_9BACL|nr:AraC family transcriptional regulator [Paenibacillus ginsengarvi]RKN76036.1 AraC family transcriptional regulator [Paenibacillus ginsengarvi]